MCGLNFLFLSTAGDEAQSNGGVSGERVARLGSSVPAGAPRKEAPGPYPAPDSLHLLAEKSNRIG